MTPSNDAQATSELLARTLDSVRAAYEDLTELGKVEGGMNSLVQTARGTALIHDLRKELDVLNKRLPFRG
ncbi:MAG: hypothetical protein ABI307_01850 [Mycobacterium sp.]